MDLALPVSTVTATVIAALLGAAIGAEREWRRHPGGLRSAALVAAAASVFAQIAGIMEQPPPIFQFSTRKQGFLAERSSQARRSRQHTDILWEFRHLVAVAP